MRIGCRIMFNSTNTYYSKMTIAEIQLVDGQTLNATDFGEFYNGVWVPKQYIGTYENCGFYLDFADMETVSPTSTFRPIIINWRIFLQIVSHYLDMSLLKLTEQILFEEVEYDSCRYNYKNGKYDITI